MITQISYEYRYGMLQGTHEFKESLKANYNVHERPKWMPAAGGNFEMWFELFFNISLMDFIKGTIAGSVATGLGKHLIIKPFIDALEKLEKANEYPLEIQKYIFQFEDSKVVVYGLTTNFNLVFPAIFNELFISYDLIQNASEYGDIHELRIAVDPKSGRNEWWVGPGEVGPYLSFWGVSTGFGVEQFIWDVKRKQIFSEK